MATVGGIVEASSIEVRSLRTAAFMPLFVVVIFNVLPKLKDCPSIFVVRLGERRNLLP